MGFFSDVVDIGKCVITKVINGVKEFGSSVFEKLTALAKSFWTKTHNWVKKAISAVSMQLKKDVLGVFFILKKTADGLYKKVSRHIMIENGGVTEQDVETNKPISASEVPYDILNKAKSNSMEIDQTQYYGELLENELGNG